MTVARGPADVGGRGSMGRQWPSVRLTGGLQLPESHLLPDAVVAFVDGELSPRAHGRAAIHLARCASCAAEAAAQRQARAAVHSCGMPDVPAGLLASLRSIPLNTELPSAPDNLAVTEDGQLVAVQRPDRAAASMSPLGTVRLGSTAPLGSSTPLGASGLAGARRGVRRTAQGAGVVVSGLVLSALALVVAAEEGVDAPSEPSARSPLVGNDVVRAQFGAATPTSSATTTLPVPPRVGVNR